MTGCARSSGTGEGIGIRPYLTAGWKAGPEAHLPYDDSENPCINANKKKE